MAKLKKRNKLLTVREILRLLPVSRELCASVALLVIALPCIYGWAEGKFHLLYVFSLGFDALMIVYLWLIFRRHAAPAKTPIVKVYTVMFATGGAICHLIRWHYEGAESLLSILLVIWVLILYYGGAYLIRKLRW